MVTSPDKFVPADSAEESGGVGHFLEEVLSSAYRSGIQSPALAVKQMYQEATGHIPEAAPPPPNVDFLSPDWHARQIGNALGCMLDMVALNRALEFLPCFRPASGELSAAMRITKSTALGGIYGGLFQPTTGRQCNFWDEKFCLGVTSAATFGTLGGASSAWQRFGSATENPNLFRAFASSRVGSSILSGPIAGVVNAEASSELFKNREANSHELAESIYAFTAIGTLMSTISLKGDLDRVSDRNTAPAEQPPAPETAARFNLEGKPGLGIEENMIDGVQKAANGSGKALVIFGSRQTGISEKSGEPYRPDSDVDLGVVGTPEDFLEFASDETWKQYEGKMPGVTHLPIRIFASVEEAVRAGYLVVKPTPPPTEEDSRSAKGCTNGSLFSRWDLRII